MSSCLWYSDAMDDLLLHVRDIDDVLEAVEKRCDEEGINTDDLDSHPAIEEARQMNDGGHHDGACFVFPDDEDDFGHVLFS